MPAFLGVRDRATIAVTGAQLTEDEFRWAEALQIEKVHGANAPRWIAERIGSLALNGDDAGISRFVEVAARLEQLVSGANHPKRC